MPRDAADFGRIPETLQARGVDLVVVGGVAAGLVLGLKKLVDLKATLGREKDLAVLAVLGATLKERQRNGW